MITVSIKEDANKVIKIDEDILLDADGALYKSVVEAIERPLIEHVLERTSGNQLKAARILGINRNTIRAKIKKLAIDLGRWKH
jgi:two-component system nitrogen regulation response regulator GlnG